MGGRSSPSFAAIRRPHRSRVVVVTAHAQESMRQAAADRGAEGFMTKPFRPADLRLAVAELLEPVPAGLAVNSLGAGRSLPGRLQSEPRENRH